jgi:hypothetical protein
LTRPEGALILPSFACVLIVMQFRSEWRCSWKRFFACGTALTLTAVLIGSVYVATTGRITNKESALKILKYLAERLLAFSEPYFASGGHHPLFAKVFLPIDNKALRLMYSFWAMISEVNQGFHYVAGIPALLGLYWTFARLSRMCGYWVLFVFTLLHTLILISLAMSVNYVSDRHVMIIVLLGCYSAVAGLQGLSQRILSWRSGAALADAYSAAPKPWWRAAPVGFVILLAALIGFCLPKATLRLHGNRTGNHQAGLWLSGQVKEGDMIADDHDWSNFFSGMVFKESEKPEIPADYQPRCFVVTTRGNDLEVKPKRQVIAADARIVYTWPERCEPVEARIVVYTQPRDPIANPWHKKK